MLSQQLTNDASDITSDHFSASSILQLLNIQLLKLQAYVW
jgi:hypothetical protein